MQNTVTKKDTKLNIINIFSQCRILNDSDEHELKKLADKSVIKHYSKYETIIYEGDRASYFYIIANGLVKVYKTSKCGKELIVDLISNCEVLGGMALISEASYYVGAQAMRDTYVVSIPKQAFSAFADNNKEVITKLTILENNRRNSLFEKMIDLVTDRVDQRVARVLFDLFNRFGNTLFFTHRDISEMTGTTSETVNRTLNKMQSNGVINLSRCKLKIIDKNKLEAILKS